MASALRFAIWSTQARGVAEIGLLRVGLCYLRLGFLHTVGLCCLWWFFLLTVAMWFGLFCLRLRIGLVLFAYGGKSVWSFVLTVPPLRKLGLFFLLTVPPTVSKKTYRK